ncbi:LuxR C-terminal-related transcriptional regulator [Kitasatospora sp. NPDC093550]|uniref:LuxR C-terminal-related transcriptional regulator n=1 Tax=Kitasatospora sp. NPDC093550 TaxID=3364089 RepID=UPI0038206E1B
MTTPSTADSPTPERHREPADGDRDAARLLRKLTPREAQTLAHLAAGHDLPHTAAALGVTPSTARSYLLRAMRKLGAATESEALTLAAGSLPYVPALRPANFAGLSPSSLGPAPRGGQAVADGGRTRTAVAAPGAGAAAAARAAGDDHDGAARVAPSEPEAEPAPPAPAAHPSAPATPPGGRRERTARRARQEPGATAHTPPREPPPTRPDQAPRPDTASPTGPETGATGPAVTTADGQARMDPARRGDTVQDARAATMAKGPQRPSGGGRAQAAAGQEGLGDGTAPATAGGGRARRAGTGAPDGPVPAAPGSSTASGEQHPAGTEGHGDMTHTVPAAPVSGGRARTGTLGARPAPPPAADEALADLPAPAPDDPGPDHPDPDHPGHGAPRSGQPRFEELYETAHTRLVQQVFLLTACRHRAVHCVRRAFGEARRGWSAAAGSGDPEGWVRVRAFELALSPWHRGGPRRAHAWGLPHRRIKVRPADESQAVLPDHDRLTDRDRALLKALKRLSRPQRRALVLHDGLGLPAAAIAVEVESTLAAAEGRVWTARAALAQWVPDLVGTDPTAPGFADGLSRLLHRAAVRGCPQPHRSPVPVLRAKHRLWTASRTGAAALLTVAVGGATLATLAGVRPAVLFRPPDPPAPSLCLSADQEEAGVPLLPGGAPNGIRSLWCSPAPGLEAVLVEPHPQAVARWEPAAARGADAPPPKAPAVCRPWSPRPCAPGPRAH